MKRGYDFRIRFILKQFHKSTVCIQEDLVNIFGLETPLKRQSKIPRTFLWEFFERFSQMSKCLSSTDLGKKILKTHDHFDHEVIVQDVLKKFFKFYGSGSGTHC